MLPPPFNPAGGDQSAIQEWAMLTKAILDQAQIIIDNFSRVKRLAMFNDLDALIDTTLEEDYVGDTRTTREEAIATRAVLNDFGVWLNTPLKELGVPPIAVMSKRRK